MNKWDFLEKGYNFSSYERILLRNIVCHYSPIHYVTIQIALFLIKSGLGLLEVWFCRTTRLDILKWFGIVIYSV